MKAMFKIAMMTLFLMCAALWITESWAQRSGKQKIRQVRRVARPQFDNQPSDIWFNDVFSEGLVGNRPEKGTQLPKVAATEGAAGTAAAGAADGEQVWSKLIGRDAVEDEIKSLSQSLAKTVTTPVRFKTNHGEVHQSMAMLSLAFAIVREFEDEIRWKDNANLAQAALQQAMINSQSNSDQAFNYCKSRKLDLEDLVRGGTFPESQKPPAEIDWSDVIGRSETMIRLEVADNQLKQWTADQATFNKNKRGIILQAQWVAAIGEAISREGMDDADDDGYLAFATAMKTAASQTVQAAQNDNFNNAAKHANLVSQSCSNCHEEWR